MKYLLLTLFLFGCTKNVPVDPPVTPKPSTPVHICYFGDSQSADPNSKIPNTMAYVVRNNLKDVSWNAVVGYSAISWVNNGLKDKVTGCDQVIFQLADNMFQWLPGNPRHPDNPPVSQSYIDRSANLIREAIGSKECIWIGPAYGSNGPTYRKTDQDLEAMYKALKISLDKINCRLIDSRGDFKYDGPDGLHYRPGENSRKWGEWIVRQLKE